MSDPCGSEDSNRQKVLKDETTNFAGADPHRFPPCQIFHNRYINKENFPSCKASSVENGTGQYPFWMTQKPWKGDFRELKSKKFFIGYMPPKPLEACAFDSRLGNRSVFILHMRLQIHLTVALFSTSVLFKWGPEYDMKNYADGGECWLSWMTVFDNCYLFKILYLSVNK